MTGPRAPRKSRGFARQAERPGVAGFVVLLVAYLFSQFYRSFLAVVAGDLSRDLGLGAAELGDLSAIWFLTSCGRTNIPPQTDAGRGPLHRKALGKGAFRRDGPGALAGILPAPHGAVALAWRAAPAAPPRPVRPGRIGNRETVSNYLK
jgi:hypothetical protein